MVDASDMFGVSKTTRQREPFASLEKGVCAGARQSMCLQEPPSVWDDASDMFAFGGRLIFVLMLVEHSE